MNEYEILYKKDGKPLTLIKESIDLYNLMSKLIVEIGYMEFKAIYKITLIKSH